MPLLTAAALLALAAPAKSADFACDEAHTLAERTICTSEVLNRLDERMARFYGWLRSALSAPDRHTLRDDQRRFLALRDACGDDGHCLKVSYLTRIEDLAERLRGIVLGRDLT